MKVPVSHLILDAARITGEIEVAKELTDQFDCLYRGTAQQNLAAVAPYIFHSRPTPALSYWYHTNGWGKSWGIQLKSDMPLAELHKHFRKFLMVQTEDGPEMYFRFYDPRALRVFLPTCESRQIKEFFGPISHFLVEDSDPEFALVFRHQQGKLITERLPVADVTPPEVEMPEKQPFIIPEPSEPKENNHESLVENKEAAQEAKPEMIQPKPAMEHPSASSGKQTVQPEKPIAPANVKPENPEETPAPPKKTKWNMFD